VSTDKDMMMLRFKKAIDLELSRPEEPSSEEAPKAASRPAPKALKPKKAKR